MSSVHHRHLKGADRKRTHHSSTMDREPSQLISSIRDDDDSFEITLIVSEFTPEEITVKTTDRNIVIHGKHAERTDQHGFISREFRRRVMLPRGVEPDYVTSTITSDGVLTVLAPKLTLEGSNERRVIPIKLITAHHEDDAKQHQHSSEGSNNGSSTSKNGKAETASDKPKDG